MTREEAYKWNENSHDDNFSTVKEMEESIHYLLKKIYDNFDIQLKELKERVRVANYYIEFYRCRCGALGRVGYLCSNEDCTEE